VDTIQAQQRQRRRYRAEWAVYATLLAALVTARLTTLVHSHDDTERQAGERLQSQARVVSANLLQQIEGVDKALVGVRDDFLAGRAIGSPDAISARMKALSDALPGMRVMFLIDAQGAVVASSRSDAIGLNVADREYVTTPRATPSRDVLYVSHPFRSIRDAWVVNLTRVLADANGRFAGAVVAGLDPDYFDVVLSSVLYAPDMRTTLVDGDGIVFLTMPHSPGPLGTSANQPGSFLSSHRRSGQDGSLATDDTQMVASRTIRSASIKIDRPMTVQVGRELDGVYAPWWRQAATMATTLSLAAAVGAGGLFWVQRRRRDYENLAAKAQRERDDSRRRLEAITDNLPILISYIDAQQRMRFLNATYRDWLGIDLEQARDRPVVEVIGPSWYGQRADALQRALGGERVEFELESEARGVTRNLRNVYLPDRATDGSIAGIYAMSIDMTELKRVERRLAELASTDSLTGLANRHQFDASLDQALARAQRSGAGLALMFLDLDHFKDINDSLGHAAGDAVLVEFARRLLSAVRATDLVARLAGDEFVIVLEGIGGELEAVTVAQKLLAAVRRPFMLQQRLLQVSTSVGIAYHHGGAATASELLAQADQALYTAKASGRNTWHLLTKQPQAAGDSSSAVIAPEVAIAPQNRKNVTE